MVELLEPFEPRAELRPCARDANSSEVDRLPKSAAVAVVLCPDRQGDISFVLTRRASNLRRHPGQFALPGGRVDLGETIEEAAQRETLEEIGIRLTEADRLGRLDDFVTRSGFRISPVVFLYCSCPTLRLEQAEVRAAYLISLHELEVPETPTLRLIDESELPVLALPIRGTLVHAPTAAIIYQLFELLYRGRLVSVSHYEQPVFAWS